MCMTILLKKVSAFILIGKRKPTPRGLVAKLKKQNDFLSKIVEEKEDEVTRLEERITAMEASGSGSHFVSFFSHIDCNILQNCKFGRPAYSFTP